MKEIQTKDAQRLYNERLFPRRIVKGDCWITDRVDNGNGYVYLRCRPLGIRLGIHVISFVAHNGPVPAGHLVRHSCDNRGCFRPSHVLSGTQTDNLNDMDSRGRRKNWHPRGTENPAVKLTPEQVVAIRICKDSGRDLAKKLGVTQALISAIRRRKIWVHL